MVPSLTDVRFVADGAPLHRGRTFARLWTGDRIVIGRHRLVAFERRYFVADGRSQRRLGRFPIFKCKDTTFPLRSTNTWRIFFYFSAFFSAAVARCSVAVLEMVFLKPKITAIFIYIIIYINIELIIDCRTTCFGTATLQQLQFY